MKRRTLLKKSAALTIGSLFIGRDMLARNSGPVYGHNGMQYRMDAAWGKLDPATHPVNDCHEMIQDRKGRIFLLTNETKNNILIYTPSGKLKASWGHDYPGAHGLTLGDNELFITDTNRHQVFKTTLDGKVLLTIDWPRESGVYAKAEEFVPTEVAVRDAGDFYIADGYGAQYILHYDSNGKLLSWFGGRGDGDKHLDNAHGICIDKRSGKETLLVTDRTRNAFKRFDLEGNLLQVIHLPGACVCRPVIHGDYLYAAVLRSPDLGAEGTGFVTILDKNDRVVSNIGGTPPQYGSDGKLMPMSQAEKIFVHPHDVCVDSDENLYVAQWASRKVYPYKFTRV